MLALLFKLQEMRRSANPSLNPFRKKKLIQPLAVAFYMVSRHRSTCLVRPHSRMTG
jgi:hypothetical protein